MKNEAQKTRDREDPAAVGAVRSAGYPSGCNSSTSADRSTPLALISLRMMPGPSRQGRAGCANHSQPPGFLLSASAQRDSDCAGAINWPDTATFAWTSNRRHPVAVPAIRTARPAHRPAPLGRRHPDTRAQVSMAARVRCSVARRSARWTNWRRPTGSAAAVAGPAPSLTLARPRRSFADGWARENASGRTVVSSILPQPCPRHAQGQRGVAQSMDVELARVTSAIQAND